MKGGMGRARDVLRGIAQRQSLFRARDVEASGLSRNWLPMMVLLGEIQQVAPGIFGRSGVQYPPVAVAAAKVPRGVACLTSALQLHGWDDVPVAEVWWAIPRSVRTPKHPPIPTRFLRIGPERFERDVERRCVRGVEVRVYSLERTMADCLRWRGRLAPVPSSPWWRRVSSAARGAS